VGLPDSPGQSQCLLPERDGRQWLPHGTSVLVRILRTGERDRHQRLAQYPEQGPRPLVKHAY